MRSSVEAAQTYQKGVRRTSSPKLEWNKGNEELDSQRVEENHSRRRDEQLHSNRKKELNTKPRLADTRKLCGGRVESWEERLGRRILELDGAGRLVQKDPAYQTLSEDREGSKTALEVIFFVLWFAQNDTNTWSFLLSAPRKNSWVGMGFSKDGFMVGSSAIVGWIDLSGSGMIKQYYLGGQSSALVKANQGGLDIVNNYTSLLIQGTTIYLAFQLQFSAPLTSASILYAIGPQNIVPYNDVLSKHKEEVSTIFDFSTGTSSTSSSTNTLKRSHGILNILGWGVFLPIGTIIARYFQQCNPAWFYLHIGFQLSGFILGVVGVALGVSLYNKINVDVDKHRALGILILSLGALQVLALFLRPLKEAKLRKYWNWYHHWVGRILLIIAAVNIFYGIHLGNAGRNWNVGYAVAVGLFLVTVAALESFVMIKRFRRPAQTPSFPVYDNDI